MKKEHEKKKLVDKYASIITTTYIQYFITNIIIVVTLLHIEAIIKELIPVLLMVIILSFMTRGYSIRSVNRLLTDVFILVPERYLHIANKWNVSYINLDKLKRLNYYNNNIESVVKLESNIMTDPLVIAGWVITSLTLINFNILTTPFSDTIWLNSILCVYLIRLLFWRRDYKYLLEATCCNNNTLGILDKSSITWSIFSVIAVQLMLHYG